VAKKIFYGWWVVAASFPISLYVSGIVYYGFTAFFEPLVKEFGWSYTEVSFAASIRGLEVGIFAPFIGLLVDRLGSRKLILAGTILTGFGLILLSLTRSLLMFYGAFFLLALGAGGCMSLVTMTAVANWFDKNVGKAFGVMSSAFGASGVIVPFIVWLIDAFYWRTALIILGVGLWIFGIPLSFVVRNKPEQSGYLAKGVLPDDSVSYQEIQTKKAEFSLRDVLKNRSFMYLILIDAIRSMAISAVVIHVMPYLSHVGISRPTASLVAAAIPLCSIAGRFGFGWMADVFEKKYVMAMTYFLMGIGLVAFCYVQVKWFLFLFLLLFPLGLGGSMVLRGVILRDYFGTSSFGTMLGIVSGSASIGAIIGPTLAGWVFDTLRNYQFAWLALIVLIALAILMILGIKKPKTNH
jgi:OFA family oxalate/formate antiporter-like MFS transporter